MSKKVRITLYILSLIAVGMIVWALIFGDKTGRGEAGQSVGNMDLTTEMVTTEDGTIYADEIPGIPEENVPDTEILNQESTTILFAGDVLIASALEKRYDSQGITAVVSEEVLAAMQDADIMMVNNEFQFSTRGEPMEDKQYTFQTNPKYVQIL